MGLRKKKTLLDKASDYVDAVKPHVESARDSALDFVNDTALPALSDARDKAAPVLADARDKAAPVLVDVRDKAAAGISDARTKAAPYVAQGAAVAVTKAGSAKDLADAKVAQLKGEPAPKSKSKLKRFVLLAAVAGAVVLAAKKLQGGKSTDNWQSSYTPSPAPATPAAPASVPTPSAPQAGLEDAAGASPDEALADAAEAPRPVSTPDEPAEVVDIDPSS